MKINLAQLQLFWEQLKAGNRANLFASKTLKVELCRSLVSRRQAENLPRIFSLTKALDNG